MTTLSAASPADELDSPYSWLRLAISLLIGVVGGIGMWSVVVALPAVQAEFGVARGSASLPYTATMVGYGVGGVLLGRLADRRGILLPLTIGAVALALGYMAAAGAQSLWQFTLAQGLLIGMIGGAATFGPLIADVSHWFYRRRGIAVAICASGNYLAGALWSPLLEAMIAEFGWRQTYMVIGPLCGAIMLALGLLLRRKRAHGSDLGAGGEEAAAGPGGDLHAQAIAQRLPVSRSTLQGVLILAGLACCIAMSMPQVHIVAYCGDLGYGPARGAEMLSLMLLFGVVSRLASGLIADRIGGAATLLIGSTAQCLALMLYLPFDGLVSLYVVSALFGLSQGGIVPSYALIVRDYFPASEAGTRVGLVMMSTIVGMAIGGWLSGLIFDLTQSYQAAFLNGIAWNMLNIAIAWWLWQLPRRRAEPAPA